MIWRYERKYTDQNANIEKIYEHTCMRASLENFVGRNDMIVVSHVPTNF